MQVKDIAHSSTINIFEHDSFSTVMEKFRESKRAVLPVVDDSGVCLGCVLRHHLYEAGPNHFSLTEYMKPLLVREHAHIIEAIRFCLVNGAESLAIVDDEDFLLGMMQTKDLFRHFSLTSGLIEKGSLIVLATNRKDYSLAEIAKIVESNGVLILHQYVSSHPESSRIEVTLLLNTNEVNDIVASFERFKYNVNYTSISTDIEELMLERYESLMHYLEI